MIPKHTHTHTHTHTYIYIYIYAMYFYFRLIPKFNTVRVKKNKEKTNDPTCEETNTQIDVWEKNLPAPKNRKD